jgi:hypothetical protein
VAPNTAPLDDVLITKIKYAKNPELREDKKTLEPLRRAIVHGVPSERSSGGNPHNIILERLCCRIKICTDFIVPAIKFESVACVK